VTDVRDELFDDPVSEHPTTIRSIPRPDERRIRAFARLAHVVDGVAEYPAPEPLPTQHSDGFVVRPRLETDYDLRTKAASELETARAAYEDAQRQAALAWSAVRDQERELAEVGRQEAAAARELDAVQQRRRALERRYRHARSDAAAASHERSELSRALQEAHLRVDRLAERP
jgi:hypothetical protein